MACYHPLEAWRARYAGPSGKRGITFDKRQSIGIKVQLPCGQCIGCRLETSRQWAMRCMHEASLHEENAFLTLTYSDESLPSHGSLVKSHFQDFMKRLRARLGYPIRYFHCGEYGEHTDRPHYHACVFGLGIPDKELYSESHGLRLYTSVFLESVWGFGFVTIGDVNFESAAYVARYVTKKVTGDRAHDHYLRCDEHGEAFWIEPEYATMSRRPGIGRGWYDKYAEEVFPDDSVIVRGKKVKPPRYYAKILEETHKEVYDQVKEERQTARVARRAENSPRRLAARELVAKARLNSKKRKL